VTPSTAPNSLRQPSQLGRSSSPNGASRRPASASIVGHSAGRSHLTSGGKIIGEARATGAKRPETIGSADRLAVGWLGEALRAARRAGDGRATFAIVSECLRDVGIGPDVGGHGSPSLHTAREDWLRRLASSRRSASTLTAYRIALDDLLRWLDEQGASGSALEEAMIVAYLDDYRRRAHPAPATYYRRFILLRRFFRWHSGRAGVRDPFRDLEAPPKPRQVADWLTPAEFGQLLKAAAAPARPYRGLAERDRLVLVALVLTGLRRSELIALDWGDLDLEGPHPSLVVRSAKGGKPRRQPLAPALARELTRLRSDTELSAEAPVFRGLRGGRLQPTILAGIIARAAKGAGIEKRVTAHTLRHTAATWLRQATGDARLVAEYRGHADLSTVHRYAHVAAPELDAAATAIAAHAGLQEPLRSSAEAGSFAPAVWSDAGKPKGESRAPAPSDSKEIAQGRLF
jgi:integrase/recombinase XerC